MSRHEERWLCAIIIAGCVFADVSTEANFVSNETRQRTVTENEGETLLADYVVRYENVTFTAATRQDTNETEYDIYFVAFNRTFTLVLHERAGDTISFRHPATSKVTVIVPLAKSHSRYRGKTGRYVKRDLDHYVSGYLRNEPTSVFHGQYSTGILDGVIDVGGETYHVRTPLNQRRSDTGTSKETFPLLVYRERDVKLPSPKKAVSSQQPGNSFVNVNHKSVTPPNSEYSRFNNI